MNTLIKGFITVAITAVFLANPALAAKPDDAGNGKGKDKGNKAKVEQPKKAYKSEGGGNSDNSILSTLGFGDRDRNIIRDYYSNDFKKGKCPPGLAKKNNGCQPPGQAKKWRKGHVLPKDVIYHDLPGDLLRQLGHDNPAYKLVRVGSDILKIGVGSGLVMEAVADLEELF